MKRINSFAPLALAALMGVSCLSACSSSDDPSDEPTVNPESVKTTFALSVALPKGESSAAKAATRASKAIVQANNEFRGMDNISLIPFSSTPADGSTRLGNSNVTLSYLSNSDLKNQAFAKVFNDVSVPVGTNNFLFYGKAIDNDANQSISTSSDKFKFGTLDAEGIDGGATSNITFSPVQIFSGDLSTNTVATALMAYLNSIIQTTYTPNGGTQSSWKDYATANPTKAMGELFTNLTGMTSGSSALIEDAIQELYTSLEGLPTESESTAGNSLNADEVTLRNAIVANITKSDYVTVATDANANTNTKLTFNDNISKFPSDINLPEGAVTLSYSSSNNTFTENTDVFTLKGGAQVSALSKYVYPANLWYFVNTPIKTSDQALADLYNNQSLSYDDILNSYDNGNGSVSVSTRSIALTNKIQYAVGRLKAGVRAASTTLYDGNGETVEVGAKTFPMTGILIGGQKAVDWKFEPTTSDEFTIYDNMSSQDSIFVTTASEIPQENYNNTLTLETKDGSDVNVVVELQNNSGKAFEGRDGVIPAGGKFYLIGQLKPESATDATTKGLTKVFQKDYKTTAHFIIDENNNTDHNKGLGAAYNVIPDLRTPALTIGLSVDLEWQSGLTFDVVM